MLRPALAAAVALTAGASLLASSPLDMRPLGPDDQPVAPPARAGHASTGGPAPISVGRGAAGERGVLLTSVDNLDSLALEPAALDLQQSNNIWSDGSITGRSRFRATTSPARASYAVAENVGGNSSPKVRLMANVDTPPDQFFFGFRYELLRTNTPLVRMQLGPDLGQPARFEHDLFVSSDNTLWSSEPISVTLGFYIQRLLWGSACLVPDCNGPVIDPVPNQIYSAGVDPENFLIAAFIECRWIGSAPIGAAPGDRALMPIGSWLRIRHETNTDGLTTASLDVGDGTGFHLIYSAPYLTRQIFDSFGGNGSYEVAMSPVYYDNFAAQGVEWRPPTFPHDLTCGQNGYLDDIQWLQPGPLRDQSDLWYDAYSSKANVDVEAGDKLIRQTNFFSDDHHREEFTRTLPSVTAFSDTPWTLCQETRLSAGSVTVRAVAPVSFLENAFVTRVSLGHWDPQASPPFSARVFVQHNPSYDPIDDPDTDDPYLPGPNGEGAVARIGGAATIGDPNYDYYDSGVALLFDRSATLCITVEDNLAMTVSYGGSPVAGPGSGVAMNAFATSVTEVRYESENQAEGHGDRFWIDDVDLECFTCPGLSLPPFALPHLDNLEWAVEGLTIGENDDDCNDATPFRWTSAPGMIVVDLGVKSNVLRMENLLRDQTQTPGQFTLEMQASTRVPRVTPSETRGYAAGARFKLTDGQTTRAWLVAEDGAGEGATRTNAALLYSAGSGTLWVLTPDAIDPVQNDPVWVDTGRTLADVGVGFNQWFTLTIHRVLNGTFIFKINARILTDDAGAVVRTAPLQSAEGGLHEILDHLGFHSGDDASAPTGSILYADNIRAWALPCPGDTNDDGAVTFADINNIIGAFNTAAAPTSPLNVAPDADGDGVADDSLVNFADLNAALAQFGRPCD